MRISTPSTTHSACCGLSARAGFAGIISQHDLLNARFQSCHFGEKTLQHIVGDGERVWLHDLALEQVTVRDQARALGRSPAILLAGDGDLEQAYDLEDIGVQGRIDWVSLISRDPQSGFTQVRVGFEAGRLHLVELIDTLDQRTRIRFFDLKENRPVAARLFEFSPPDGVDVIDQSEQFP